LDELDPRTTLELLPDWERVCDLPDTGAALGETIAARRGAVQARLTATGGQNAPYFIALAAALGFEIEIYEYRARLHGRRRMGTLYGTREMQFVWAVRPVDGSFRRQRRLHQGFHGEPYAVMQYADLVALLQKLKPAHSTVLFQ
ncbi:MAG: putative phage tail protein, partial [Rhodospirillaceae bacterium]